MSISFAPACTREFGDVELADLRISLVEYHKGTKSRRGRSRCIDFRITPEVCRRWGLSHGDRVVGEIDDDGAWTLRRCDRKERGYTVRIGGAPGVKVERSNGRPDHGYFRFSATAQQSRVIFPVGVKSIEYDLMDVDGDKAMFLPKVAVRRMVFQPAN